MMILFKARILYQTLTKLVLTRPRLLVAVCALDFAATSSSFSSSSFSVVCFFVSTASFSDVPTGLYSFLLFIRAFEGNRQVKQRARDPRNGTGERSQRDQERPFRVHFQSEPNREEYSLLTHDAVVDLLLFRLDPPVPFGHLLVDTAAHPGPRDILRITIPVSLTLSFLLIDLPSLGAGTIARKHRPIVQVL